jgi:hypothetical protein
VKRCSLDRETCSLESDAKLGEDIINEALIARFVCQPIHNVEVSMRGDEIDVWRRIHSLGPER